MPDPQLLLEEDDFDNEIETETYNNTTGLKAEPLISKTQIKNTIQEKKEVPKIKPDTVNLASSTQEIHSFQELVDLTNQHKEIELKFDLERNVRLVKFDQGKIDISFNESLSKDFIKNLSLKLNEWTGKRWMITLSKAEGETSIYETKSQLKEETLKDIKQTEAYKKVLEAFPDAELIDVQEEDQK